MKYSDYFLKFNDKFKRFHVYALLLRNGCIYIGQTGRIIGRINQHLHKNGAEATIKNKPVKMIYLEKCQNRVESLRRESFLKNVYKKDKSMFLNYAEWMCGIRKSFKKYPKPVGWDKFPRVTGHISTGKASARSGRSHFYSSL